VGSQERPCAIRLVTICELLIDELNDGGALPHCGRDALHRPVSDIAGGEDARDTRLEQHRGSSERPATQPIADGFEVVYWQGHGLGRELFGQVIERARPAGLDSLIATIRSENNVAARLARAAGFSVAGRAGIYTEYEMCLNSVVGGMS
jgi:GNAT superfamily N-acetyltransferase